MTQNAREDDGLDEGTRLCLALCHEIGNLLGAVRLQAHLLDEDLGRKQIALASIEIDDLSARAAALLRQMRPLLAEPAEAGGAEDPAAVVAGIEHEMAEQGVRGVRFEARVAAGVPPVAIEREVIHHLLASLLQLSCEAAKPRGHVVLQVESRPGEVTFAVEDDALDAEDPSGWRQQPLRGRALLCAVADLILRRRGGRLEAVRRDGRTRIELRLPGA
jgi:nitrogen-specific signal transduction histidine kinase